MYLLYIPVLDFFVDFLCDADKEWLPYFANIEAIAPLEGIKPITSDSALVCY